MESLTASYNDRPIAGNADTSFLKVLALAFMLTDHLGAAIFPGVTELRVIGRMAFPLYAWCLVVGSEKTRSIPRYGLRILLLGLVSQPLYMAALNHAWLDLNILFSMTAGLAAIYGIKAKWYGSQVWVPVLCFILHGLLKMDYGWRGLAFILVLYGARKTRSGLAAAYLAYALSWGGGNPIPGFLGIPFSFLNWPAVGDVLKPFFRMQSMIWLSLPLILNTFQTGLRLPKWLGYALYPMHLAVLMAIKLLLSAHVGALFHYWLSLWGGSV